MLRQLSFWFLICQSAHKINLWFDIVSNKLRAIYTLSFCCFLSSKNRCLDIRFSRQSIHRSRDLSWIWPSSSDRLFLIRLSLLGNIRMALFVSESKIILTFANLYDIQYIHILFLTWGPLFFRNFNKIGGNCSDTILNHIFLWLIRVILKCLVRFDWLISFKLTTCERVVQRPFRTRFLNRPSGKYPLVLSLKYPCRHLRAAAA